MEEYWGALEYASAELKRDREIVQEAVKKSSGYALKYASADLQGDDEIVDVASRSKERKAFEFASGVLKQGKSNTFHDHNQTANFAQIMELADDEAMSTPSAGINSGSGEDENRGSSLGTSN